MTGTAVACTAAVVICLCLPSAAYLAEHWQDIALGLSGLSVGASMLTAVTPTPAPGSRWARVYRMLELFALVVGRAKDSGLLPRTPTLDRLSAEIARMPVAPAPPPAAPPPAGG